MTICELCKTMLFELSRTMAFCDTNILNKYGTSIALIISDTDLT
jgi:hypothetical protein